MITSILESNDLVCDSMALTELAPLLEVSNSAILSAITAKPVKVVAELSARICLCNGGNWFKNNDFNISSLHYPFEIFCI